MKNKMGNGFIEVLSGYGADMSISPGLLPNLPPIFARFTSYNSSGIPLILSRSL